MFTSPSRSTFIIFAFFDVKLFINEIANSEFQIYPKIIYVIKEERVEKFSPKES